MFTVQGNCKGWIKWSQSLDSFSYICESHELQKYQQSPRLQDKCSKKSQNHVNTQTGSGKAAKHQLSRECQECLKIRGPCPKMAIAHPLHQIHQIPRKTDFSAPSLSIPQRPPMTDGQLFIHGSEPLLKENQNTKRFCISVTKLSFL